MVATANADNAIRAYRSPATWAAATDRVDWILLLILIAGLVHAIYYLFLGIAHPLLDDNPFRQTQTALSAYWIWRGGAWLAYETPVIGYPWSIPFEFPIYQGLVAMLRVVGVPIDIGGRLLTFGFYIGCLWPLWSFFRSIKLSQTAFLAAASLFLWSPMCVYWGRTVLIEFCALFFCLLWLALLARFLEAPTLRFFIGAVLAGVAGILCKVTTFPAAATLAGILVLADIYRAWCSGTLMARLRVLALVVALVVIPFAAELAWVAFSDAVKAQSQFGAFLTSKALVGWNFGSWRQRTDIEQWRIVWDRSLLQIFGPTAIVALVVGAMGLLTRRYTVTILAAALAFMVPFLVFTNLHFVHNFYQVANAIFALAGLGIAIVAVAEGRHRALAPLLVIFFVCSQIYFFHRNLAPMIAADPANDRIYLISKMARDKTQPTDSLIVIGQDWSSAVAYYSERKSLTMPGWAPADLARKALENPQSYLGDAKLGGVVICSDSPSESATDLVKRLSGKMPSLAEFVGARAILGEVQGCQLLAPERPRR